MRLPHHQPRGIHPRDEPRRGTGNQLVERYSGPEPHLQHPVVRLDLQEVDYPEVEPCVAPAHKTGDKPTQQTPRAPELPADDLLQPAHDW